MKCFRCEYLCYPESHNQEPIKYVKVITGNFLRILLNRLEFTRSI
jgi:hypothetical protein